MTIRDDAQDFAPVDTQLTLGLGLVRSWIAEARRAKYKLVLPIIFAIGAASLYLHLAIFIYTAELKVTPSPGDGAALGSNVSSLAAIAGVGLPRGQTSNFSLYLEILNSRAAAENLARNEGLMRTVFADRWADGTRSLSGLAAGADAAKRTIKNVLGIPNYPKARPNAADLQKFIGEQLSVSENPKRGVSTISFSFRDPKFAKLFLEQLNATADAIVRQRTLTRTAGYISYLEAKLQTVSLAEHRAALASSLSDQERTRMLASSTLPFSAETIGAVSVSNRPTNPQPLVILGLATFLGISAGIGWIFLAVSRQSGLSGTDPGLL